MCNFDIAIFIIQKIEVLDLLVNGLNQWKFRESINGTRKLAFSFNWTTYHFQFSWIPHGIQCCPHVT